MQPLKHAHSKNDAYCMSILDACKAFSGEQSPLWPCETATVERNLMREHPRSLQANLCWFVGKTTLVRSMAALCNAPLVEIALTAGTDTSDILGGFEQSDPNTRLLQSASSIAVLLQRASLVIISLINTDFDAASRSQLKSLSSAFQICNESSATQGEAASISAWSSNASNALSASQCPPPH